MFKILHRTIGANAEARFDFGAPVAQCLVGISYFKLAFERDEHWVKDMALGAASHCDPSSHVVKVKTRATLTDNSGSRLSVDHSYVTVSCIASLAAPDMAPDDIHFGNKSTLVGGPGSDLGFPGTDYDADRLLNGFSILRATDRRFKELYVMPYAVKRLRETWSNKPLRGSPWFVDPSGDMMPHGISDNNRTVDVGYVMYKKGTPRRLLSKVVGDKQTKDHVQIDFGTKLDNAVPMIQDFNVSFPEEHNLLTIGGGTSSWWLNGSVLSLGEARVFVEDASGNQATASSSVSMIAFGVPAA